MKKVFTLAFMFLGVSAYCQLGQYNQHQVTYSNVWDDYMVKENVRCDLNGMMHISYQSYSQNQNSSVIFYNEDSSSAVNWPSPVTIDFGTVQNSTMALFPVTNEPVIAYDKSVAGNYTEIWVAERNAGVWSTSTVTNDTLNDYSPAIDIDSLGNIHLAWLTDSADYVILKYATRTNGSWNFQEVMKSNIFITGGYYGPNLKVLPDGTCFIAFLGSTSGPNAQIQFVENNGLNSSAWTANTFIPVNSFFYNPQLFIDHNKNIHLAVSGMPNYSSGTKVSTEYFNRPFGQSTFSQQLMSGSYSAACSDIEVDLQGGVHMVLKEVIINMGLIETGRAFYMGSLNNFTYDTLAATVLMHFPQITIDPNQMPHFFGSHIEWPFPGEIYHLIPDIQTGMALQETKAEVLSLYPNPSAGTVTFALNSSKPCHLGIFNSLGQLVHSVDIGSSVDTTATVDLSHLPGGIYIIRDPDYSDNVFQKLVICRD